MVDHLAIVVILLFALGLARAWEFAGARATGASRAPSRETERGEP